MGIQKIKEDACTACGLCFEACPMDVIRLDDDGRAYAAYPWDCIVCYSCERECPVDAVVINPERPKSMPAPW